MTFSGPAAFDEVSEGCVQHDLQPMASATTMGRRSQNADVRPQRHTHMEYAKQLVLHGAIILLVGFLCGAPLGSAAVRGKEEAVRAWRVAHSSLILGGVLLLALAGVISHLSLSAFGLALLVWTFVASSYVFAVVLPLAARYGHRGLTSAPPFLNRIIYLGNMVGAGGLLIGVIVLLWGAYVAL